MENGKFFEDENKDAAGDRRVRQSRWSIIYERQHKKFIACQPQGHSAEEQRGVERVGRLLLNMREGRKGKRTATPQGKLRITMPISSAIATSTF